MPIAHPIQLILKLVVAVILTGAIGFGFFCGGALIGLGSGNEVVMYVIWGIGVLVWLAILKGIFSIGKRKIVESRLAPKPMKEIPQYLLPAVSYAVGGRRNGYEDAEIARMLLSSGWNEVDVAEALRLA